ncbi:MAG: TonB-dependent receptor [Candidatus Omnitrophica bacterium]|nr:TonB-dependent receptor [Candidatus Omnitrophota bacterium]MBU4478078.1 TonB-dependent receptor [Candidatus Omnitrophota bacterium]MCG2704350.1 TonB-dependent receptor [Candidatus Omnitrophota bacterium]
MLKVITRLVMISVMWNLFAPGVFANEAVTELFLFGEEDLVVTAARYEQKVSEAAAIITVITAEDIKKGANTTLLEVLSHLPGATEALAMSGMSSVVFRGQSIGAVKLMIDGHSLNEPLYGWIDWWTDFDLDIVKQIEIIRGPGSALYGTDAFSGVINIITKKGDDIKGVEVNAKGGSFKTAGGSILVGDIIKDDLSYRFFLQQTKSKGPSCPLEYDILQGAPYTLCPGGKMNEGFKTTTIGLDVENNDFYVRSIYFKYEKDTLIGALFALTEEKQVGGAQYLIEGAYNFKLNEDTILTPKAYYHYWDDVVLDGNVFPAGYYTIVPALPPYIPKDFNGDGILEYWPEGVYGGAGCKSELYGTELKLETSLSETAKVIGGIFLEKSSLFDVYTRGNMHPVYYFNLGAVTDVPTFNAGGKRTIQGAFAQFDWKIRDSLAAIVGARYENYSDFGNTFNPRCGLIWEFSEKGNLKLLYGTAFRAPTFGELYNQNQPVAVGNKDLNPQKIQTGEISLSYKPLNRLGTDVTVFKSKITDGIGLDDSSKVLPTDPANFGNVLEMESTGIETQAKYYFKEKTYLYSSYVYVESKTGGEDTAGMAQHSGSLGLNLNFAKYYNWNTMLYYVGDKPRDVAGGDTRDSLSSYTLVDTAFLIEGLIKEMDIKFIIKNVFDKTYYYPSTISTSDYTRPGRNYYMSVGYKF